jgi:iron complex outermembrane receptor protein
MKEVKLKYWGILAAILFYAAPCSAQEAEIEKIVVTASRTQEDIKNSAKSITVIDSQDILESNAHTIPDILRSEAGIQIRDYNGSGKQVNVDIGGFGETGPSNMLVLIDGRRVNAIDLSNTDWSQISLSQVERIEVLRGASSVLYGDNACGGVVNIITKKGKGKPTVKIESKGGSYETASTSVESSGASDKSSYRVSAEYLNTDGYRKNSGLFRKDFGFNVSHLFNEMAEADLTFGYHSDRYGLPGALKGNEISSLGRRATTKPNDSARADDWFSSLSIKNDFHRGGKLSTDFSVRTREVDSSYISSSWRNENHVVTLGMAPKYTLEHESLGVPQKLTFGLDLYHDADHILDGSITGANDTLNITKTSLGVYGQEEFRLHEHLIIKTGLRHEIVKYIFDQIAQAKLKEKSNLAKTVYDLGIVLPFDKESSAFFNYSTSFRYPLVDEFYTSFNPDWGVGGLNSSLKPQTGKNIEAGLRHTFLNGTLLETNYFRNNITDEIYLNADPLVYTNSNYDKTVHQGGHLQIDIPLTKHTQLFSNYTFTQAKFDKGALKGKKIPGVPIHKASLGTRFLPNEKIKINLIGNYVGSMYLISDQNNAYPRLKDWLSVDMNVSYSAGAGNMELFFGINNIFNAYYAEYGILSVFSGAQAFYPAQGRNVVAGWRYKF